MSQLGTPRPHAPNCTSTRRHVGWLAAFVCLVLAGCTGDDGAPGAPGVQGPPGPPAPPNPSGAVNIASATAITGAITLASVSASGQPAVEFQLIDDLGRGLFGLTASQVRFAVARLTSGANGGSSEWRSYITRIEQPGPIGPGSTPQLQGTTETGTAGQLVDRGDGRYRYTFAKNITNDAAMPYNAMLTHRVALEISGLAPANNASYTFQPAGGNLFSREIVSNAACNACHDRLEFHGGARTDIQYCAMCHNPYTVDAQSGNSMDAKILLHKIHMGRELPSVVAGGEYAVYGFGGRVDYSDVAYPQDVRNCLTCHSETDAATPQAGQWRTVANAAACGSCHDDVNFATGQGHSDANLASSDAECLICHGSNSTVDNGRLRTERAHEILEALAAARFRYSVLNVTNASPGQTPSVTIRVTDPVTNQPYDITDPAGPFRQAQSSLRVDLAWTTRDFHNRGSGSATATSGAPAQPVAINFLGVGVTANPDLSFTATSPISLPAFLTGSGSAILEGRPRVDANNDGALESLTVAAAGIPFAITDAAATARRRIVDIQRCNDCHQTLSLHGNNRTDNAELCASCHNAHATDIARRASGSQCVNELGADDVSIDFKYMVHALHAADYRVCGFGNTPHDYRDLRYPGRLDNCEGCHRADTYYPVDGSTVLATTMLAGANRLEFTDDVVISPNTAVCSACHADALAREHMRQNGGDFNATKAVDGSLVSSGVETCALCHGPGRVADVKRMHRVP
jgi:OmcA/MtrC family decaheme c-type cytochrome